MNSTETPIHGFADAWWQRVRAGECVVQRCARCRSLQMYPRRRCLACAADELEVAPVSGKGTLYTFTTVLRNAPSDFQAQLPYTLAVVILAEGPRLLTRLVNCAPEQLRCDLPVRWTLATINGRQLPCFEPD